MKEGRKTVIVTGASRGIGHAIARCFVERDWRIITCSRGDVPLECKRDPNWTLHVPTDLGDAETLSFSGTLTDGDQWTVDLDAASGDDLTASATVGSVA